MIRLLRLTLIIFTILTVLIGGARAIGQTIPLSEHVARLHLTDCEPPCWADIMPGQTTLDEARERLLQRYPAAEFFNDDNGIELHLHNFSMGTMVYLGVTDNIVTDIVIRFSVDDMPTLQQVISVYGVPGCWASAIVSVGWATLIYRHVLASMTEHKLTALVEDLRFQPEKEAWQYCQEMEQLGGIPWKKFYNEH